MATLYTVLCALQAQVSAVTQGLISTSVDTPGKPLTVQVGLYWPSAKALQNNVRPANGANGQGPTALVTVYDRGLAADSTRWLPAVVGQTLTAATLTATLSENYVQQLATTTIVLGGVPTLGDAVGVVLSNGLGASQAAVAIAVAGDTAITMAAKLVTLLQANPTIMTWVTASSLGSVVTLTSLLSGPPIALSANVGNGGVNLTEIGRRKRHFQIVVWTRTPDDRITVGDPIEALIANLEANFGLTFADGTMGRLTFSGDTQHDEATLSDTARRDFFLCVDYGINVTDITFSILAPIAQNTTF
jgi:hypothetical protein